MKRNNHRAEWERVLAERIKGAPIESAEPPRLDRTPSQIEHQIQCDFIEYCDVMAFNVPELATVYAIPNGGHRHPLVGGRLKREGVRAGMPDLCLPVQRGRFGALYLETKAPGGEVKKHQIDRIRSLRAVGNVVAVCFSLDELINITEAYLNGDIVNEQGDFAGRRPGARGSYRGVS